MLQGLASDHWSLYLWSPRNACMEQKPTVITGLPGIFSEIALNDKGGESLDKESNFSSQGTVPSGTNFSL